MLKFNVILAIFTLSIISCSIKGSFQGLFSYQKKVTRRRLGLIKRPDSSICELQPQAIPIVYSINGLEMKECLKSIEKSLIYIWKPNCSSSKCISPTIINEICKKNKFELFVVAEYYDFDRMIIDYQIDRPIFAVDGHYYHTNLTRKYMSKFLSDVLGVKIKYDGISFFQINQGEFISKGESLREIISF